MDSLRVRSYICGLFLGFPLALMLGLSACSKSDNAPTQPGGTWTISGKTYLAGSTDPVAGVTVKCAGISIASGADGSYQIRGVPGGTYTLTAEKIGCENYSQSIEVKSNVSHYVYLRFKTTNLWGNVYNAVHGPTRGARAAIYDLVDETDISGRYEFCNVPQGTHRLSITHPDYPAFDTLLSLSVSEKQFDVALTKELFAEGELTLNTYVDETQPTTSFYYSSRLFLSANGYDSLGQYHGNVRRHIYIFLNFPKSLMPHAASIVEANLELCADAPYPSFAIETFSLRSGWNSGNLTYNTQPAVGSLLFSASIGDTSSARYWTVLDIDGFNQVLAEWRASGYVSYGVVIKGGGVDPRGFYSGRASQNRPKLTLKVRY